MQFAPDPESIGLACPNMSLIYQVMYRVGFTPWDNDEIPAELAALVDGDDALPPGRALDIGCGTGTQAVHLARAGWTVTGIDAVEKPLVKARRRAASAAVAVDWIQGRRHPVERAWPDTRIRTVS